MSEFDEKNVKNEVSLQGEGKPEEKKQEKKEE